MNGAQDLTTTGGGQLSQTGNPQTGGGQSLINQKGGLQSASSDVLSGSQATISSVGSSQFNPVTLTPSTTAPVSPTENSFSANPYLIGMAAVLLCFAALVFIAITRSSQPRPKNSQ